MYRKELGIGIRKCVCKIKQFFECNFSAPVISFFPPSLSILHVLVMQLGEDGAVTNTFSHKCKLPSSVDPVSVTMSMESSGALTVRALRVL